MADSILDNDELGNSVDLANKLVDSMKNLQVILGRNKELTGGMDNAMKNALKEAKDLSSTFRNIVGVSGKLNSLELKKLDAIKLQDRLLKSQLAINKIDLDLTKKQLEEQGKILEHAEFEFNITGNQIKQLEDKILKGNKLSKNETERLGILNRQLSYQRENRDTIQESVDSLKETVKYQEESLDAINKTNKDLDQYIKGYDKATIQIGLFGRVLKGLSSTPLVGDLVNANGALEAMTASARSGGSAFQNLGSGFKAAFSGIEKSTLMLAAISAIVVAFKELMKIGFEVSRQVTEIGKSMALSADTAELLRNDFIAIQYSSDNIFVTTKNLVEAQTQLQEATGTTVRFTEDQLKSQLLLTKQYGLSAELAGDLQNIAIFNNQTAEQTTDSVIKQTSLFARQKGIQLDNRKVFGEITKISGQLRINLQNNAEEMTKAVLLSKQYGINLEQAKNIAGGLLDFDSSISAELEAELLTGKQLNLEQARYLALTGKTAEAAADVLKQVGSAQQFGKLNVIAQQAFAQAVGLSVDELSDSLTQQENLNKLGIQNRKLIEDRVKVLREEGRVDEANKLMRSIGNDDDAKAALTKIDAQTKFNESLDKMKALLTSIVEGPAFKLVESFANLLSVLGQNKIVLAGLVGIMGALAAEATVLAIASTLGVAAGPIALGLATVAGATAGVMAATKQIDDGIIDSDGGLVVSGPKGAYSLNKDDKVFASPNIDKPGTSSNSGVSSDLVIRKLDELINVIKQGGDVILDGNKVGQALVLSNYRMQ